MRFEFTSPQTGIERMLGGYYCINAFGEIVEGDEVEFERFLTRTDPPPRTPVYIDSGGGDVDAAISIGRTIRGRWFSTSIGRQLLDHSGLAQYIVSREILPGRCMSAATLIFLRGRLRYYSGGCEFGVHQFSFKNPLPDDVYRSQVLSAKIARFVADMGISAAFIEISASTPSNALNLVDRVWLTENGVLTGGETKVEWTVQANHGMMYVRGERDSIYGHHKVMLCYTKGAGFIFWAVIEAQGRAEELTKFGLVEISLSGQSAVIDISERCDRIVNGLYVNIMASISDDEARMIAYSDGSGIQIRMTTEAPMFYGIAPMSAETGKEKLRTFFGALSAG